MACSGKYYKMSSFGPEDIFSEDGQNEDDIDVAEQAICMNGGC